LQPANKRAPYYTALIYDLLALMAFVFFYVLGRYVAAHGEPALLQTWASALFDRSTLVAWWLTWMCYVQVLLPICIALLIVAWLVPAWRIRALLSIALLLVSWRGADLFQHLFARARPLDWVVKHETAFGYPSSHAAIVAGFYWLWAAMLYSSNPRCAARVVSAASLAILGLAICWSRLSLGAHYVTDIIGGILFAVALVAAATAVYPQLFARDAGRLSGVAE
jgi:membrane-associated phospholipid phosphatase